LRHSLEPVTLLKGQGILKGDQSMKKMFSVAAAAVLLSIGNASASTKTTNLTITLTIDGVAVTCPFVVTQTTVHKRISSRILLSASSSDCSFYGGGLIGAADNTGSTPLTNVATVSGYSSLAAEEQVNNVTLLFQLTPDNAFKNHLKYWAYGSLGDGNGGLGPQMYFSSGRYTVNK
jgi:hypothetical protein